MRRRILSLLLCISVSVTALVGCGSDSKEIIDKSDKGVAIPEDTSTKDNKQVSLKDWKKYCLTDEFLEEVFDEYEEQLYDIVDTNNDGIPEVLTEDNIISFYNLCQDNEDIDVKEPEVFNLNYVASSIFFLEDSNTIILPMSDISLNSPCAFIVRNWMCDDSSSMKIDYQTVMKNSVYERTGYFDIDYDDCDNEDLEGVSAQEAINLANEFVGVDVTFLQPADYPYTLGELVEALRNY